MFIVDFLRGFKVHGKLCVVEVVEVLCEYDHLLIQFACAIMSSFGLILYLPFHLTKDSHIHIKF